MHVICALCGSSRFQRLPFHYAWEGRRFQGVRCRRCSLVTIEPHPTAADLRRLYAAEYFAHGLHGLDRLGTDYETHAGRGEAGARRFVREEVLPRAPRPRRLFEIGAAMGHFLAAARAEGLEVGGLEISPEAAARARDLFGLELVTSTLEGWDPGPQAGRWDVVYLGDVLEHLRDPAGALDKVAALLAPGGLCVARLPSTMDLLFTRLAMPLLRVLGRDRRLPDPPYHLHEFTAATARRLFATRFPRVEVRSEATPPARINLKDRSAGYLAKQAFQLLNWPLTRATGSFGDRLTVWAWKEGPAGTPAGPR